MFRFLGLLVAVAGLVLASEARGQIVQHADGQGYSITINSTTHHYRNGQLQYSDKEIAGTTTRTHANGTQESTTRIGNASFYRNNLGMSGSSIQAGSTRFDNYSNPYTGQSTNGFTAPWGWNYQRMPARPIYPSPYFRPYRSPYGW